MARKSRKRQSSEQTASRIETAQYIPTAQYIRLSVEDSNNKGNSIENQQLILDDFLARTPELQLYDTYIDNGVSGTTFRRAEFQRMLDDIEDGRIGCVMVKDLSRLGRNVIDTGFYIEKHFPLKHVRFIAVTDNFDSDNPGSNGLMMPLKNIINEAYAIDIGKKIKAQQQQAINAGDYVAARPLYGYLKDPCNCHKLIIDEKTAPVVRQIFDWAYEHLSLDEIVLRLNEAKIDPPNVYAQKNGIINFRNIKTQGIWNSMSVKRLIENRNYTGDLVQGKTTSFCRKQTRITDKDKWVVVENTHEAIVSKEQFDAVQKYRREVAESARLRQIDPYTPNMFLKKIFCGYCGKPMHRQRKKYKSGTTYCFKCPSNSRVARGVCSSPYISENDVVSTIISVLKTYIDAVTGMRNALSGLVNIAGRTAEKNREINELKQYISKNKDYLRSLYESLMGNIISAEEYKALKNEYEQKISGTVKQIYDIEKEYTDLENRYEHFCEYSDAIEEIIKDEHLTAELIQILVDRILIYNDKRIEVIFSFESELKNGDRK